MIYKNRVIIMNLESVKTSVAIEFMYRLSLKNLKQENFLNILVMFRYCIQLGLFSLSNILQSQHTRDTLVREGLLDYLVCIPWLYPTNWTKEKKQAKDLLNYVGNHLQLQPPSLITISKARLAGYLGLEKVLSADIHQMLAVAI